ncbi:FMN-binding protein [Muricauda sp. JGD-17]|uniref:FMN-binding protein n=1 Tax=Flagellimonas ochracea TaxID=2696472 RepID=A0A964TAP2_9FLAO|nr:FMN-binding protein [Allomuricauda ochracea]NAY91348.1 FMN-binding protein [Allomuricauda ochracea]
MKKELFLVAFIGFLIWNCKQQADAAKPKVDELVTEAKTTSQIPSIVEELFEFANVSHTATTDINELMLFKEIDQKELIHEIDMDRAVSLYKQLMKRKESTSFPIFEIKGAETAILSIQGIGYGGAIWAKVLVDKNTLEIKKIAFDHKAESEGYGAAMTGASFENQFVGNTIDFDKNNFRLERQIEKRTDDGSIVEGISGATMTSEAVVEMVNIGLRRYKAYLLGH